MQIFNVNKLQFHQKNIYLQFVKIQISNFILIMTLRKALSTIYILLPILILATIMSCAKETSYRHKHNAKDSVILANLHEQALNSLDFDVAIKFANQALSQARELHCGEGQVDALLLLFDLYYDNGRNEEAFEYAAQACVIADSIGNHRQLAKSYHSLGNVLSRFDNSPIASKNLANSFHLYFMMRDTNSVLDVWRDMVAAYYKANIFDSALTGCQRCLFFDRKYNDNFGMSKTLAQYGSTELAMFRSNILTPNYEHLYKAHDLLKQAENINRQYKDPKTRKIIASGLLETYYYMSVIAKSKEQCVELAEKAREYIPEASNAALKTGVPEYIHHINILCVKTLYGANDKKATEQFVDSLAAVAERSNTYTDNETAYRAKSILAAYNGNFHDAFEYRVLAEKNRELTNYSSQSFKQTLLLAKSQHDTETSKALNRESVLKTQAKQQWTMLMVAVLCITMLFIIAALIYRNYKHTQRQSAKINAINEEMRVQSEIIRKKSEELMEGISYASIIQVAAMPSQNEMYNRFGDHLAYYAPRDIVSGDFFWSTETASGRYKLLAVGDCTGHGVPGALLSMLGMSILDYTTRHFGEGEISAGAVLDKMRTYFKRSLNQTSFRTDQTVDSIDIALLVFDTVDKVMHYAAAYRPLLMFRYNKTMMRMKADSMPIGIYLKEKPHFTDNMMKLCKGDIIYLYTDGITDQGGYEDAAAQYPRAYSNKRFFNLLKEVFRQPFELQKARISIDRDEWRRAKSNTQAECELTDDATLVGIAVDNFMHIDDTEEHQNGAMPVNAQFLSSIEDSL